MKSYLEWNQLVVDKKSTKNLIDLLESFLDAGMVSKMDTDESIKATTEVWGPEGILLKIIEYYLDHNPLINRRHEFTIQEHNPTLPDLVRMAGLWQNADSAQTAFGTKAQEYIRQTYNEEESEFQREGCTETVKKTSDYKTSMNDQWKNERRTNDRDRQTSDRRSLPPNIDRCQGCGAQKDKMHTREMCPATDRDCYNCRSRGHFC